MSVRSKMIVSLVFVSLTFSWAVAHAEIPESAAKAEARKKAAERMRKEAAEAKAAEARMVDLNKATKEQLMSLPQIGEEEADKIISGRPYFAKTQLRDKDILPSSVFYAIFDRIEIRIDVPPKPQPAAPAPVKAEKKKGQPKKNVFRDFMK